MDWIVSPEITYMVLVLGLFILPRVLQRYKIPNALTCVIIGAVLNIGFGLFHEDHTVKLLATLGIVSMFLFAGLEVNFDELRRGRRILLQHIVGQLVILLIAAAGFSAIFDFDMRAALLFSLALFTPSTGFILDSLNAMGLSDEERFWVKSKAIAAEFVALTILFFTVQSVDGLRLGISAFSLVAMVLVLPPLFHVFNRFITPFAPKTEFTFLIIIALICALITRELGVYYLIGAFVVGLTAVRLRHDLPELSSERVLTGIELFATFFIPFYFLKAGLHLEAEYFSARALAIAAILLVVVLPIRVFRVAMHRRFALREPWSVGTRIGAAVIPTLVFTIVIADILQEKFALSPDLYGALIIFTLVNTLLPAFFFRLPTPDYENPSIPREEKLS